jgi:hypothetical protein
MLVVYRYFGHEFPLDIGHRGEWYRGPPWPALQSEPRPEIVRMLTADIKITRGRIAGIAVERADLDGHLALVALPFREACSGDSSCGWHARRRRRGSAEDGSLTARGRPATVVGREVGRGGCRDRRRLHAV